MPAKRTSDTRSSMPQEVCIDLPGESVQCWRSSNRVKVVLRKHRDVFFDINLGDGSLYTVESKSEFYSPKDKKLLKKIEFKDGTRLHVWVGRSFNSELILRASGKVIGIYRVDLLDTCGYGADPKIKPEPLMIVMGKESRHGKPVCRVDDPFAAEGVQREHKLALESRFSILKDVGSKFDYQIAPEPPPVVEYVAVTEAMANEIRPEVLKSLDESGVAEGKAELIFLPPRRDSTTSPLYAALASAVTYISTNEMVTSNAFKETVGYLQENYRRLDKIAMRVRVEKKPKGNYRVVFKGRPFIQWVPQLNATRPISPPISQSYKMGAKETAFVDGNFGRTGKNGFGSVRRIMLTASENFRGGVKIQVIGTIIDLIGDANAVYFDEKGSRDLSEFLGRAGVSVVKAGATAMLGSVFAAAGAAMVTAFFASAGLPVFALVAIVIGGYILAATAIDMIDSALEAKNRVADWAR